MLVGKADEFASDVGFHALAKRRVERGGVIIRSRCIIYNFFLIIIRRVLYSDSPTPLFTCDRNMVTFLLSTVIFFFFFWK